MKRFAKLNAFSIERCAMWYLKIGLCVAVLWFWPSVKVEKEINPETYLIRVVLIAICVVFLWPIALSFILWRLVV